ncbi:hypothetical protein [Candidatus Rhabdochlamydia sp. T3358]|uniref:hypothetical protein n=1 Tax=Candidatus Rhabdochlamydia sp. T3358 TaxID=2099795 RepID=UPI0010B38F74|nr:hypothetical protein [Candidatus Rhabdochlamydia sp. T3358]VHN99642.1 hypothetical protein RHT_00087 [Candidatus Rhabdochlamydia sp. T3358]
MGIQLMLLASFFVAISNFFMRRSIDSGGSTKGFLMIMLSVISLIAVFLNPIRMADFSWSYSMALFAVIAGIILSIMLTSLGKTLESGPPGLTFAALNASTVLPMVAMVLLFGSKFGYFYTTWNAFGSILMVIGLFWAGYSAIRSFHFQKWLIFMTVTFFLHILFLLFFQWRALCINFPEERGLFFPFENSEACCQWFMPIMYATAALLQTFIYFKTRVKALNRLELQYGIYGGLTNGVGTFFMILSTEASTSLEHAAIFPVFAITVIVFCNLWGKWFYREKVNWMANGLCLLGILIGSLDWETLLATS